MPTFRALQKGYAAGKVFDEGDVFSHEFIGRDGKEIDDPSWVERTDDSKSKVEAAIQAAEDGDDPNLEDMDGNELNAWAAGLTPQLDVSGIRSLKDKRAAIRAHPDPTR